MLVAIGAVESLAEGAESVWVEVSSDVWFNAVVYELVRKASAPFSRSIKMGQCRARLVPIESKLDDNELDLLKVRDNGIAKIAGVILADDRIHEHVESLAHSGFRFRKPLQTPG